MADASIRITMRLLAQKFLTTVRRRVVVLESLLESPEAPPGDLEASLLTAGDLDKYAVFRKGDAAKAHARLALGHWCVTVRDRDEIVSATWLGFERAHVDYLACDIVLASDEVYAYDAFTAPEYRGRQVSTCRRAFMFRELRARGCRRILAVVAVENDGGLRTTEQGGFRQIGTYSYLRFGPFSRRAAESFAGHAFPTFQPEVQVSERAWTEQALVSRRQP